MEVGEAEGHAEQGGDDPVGRDTPGHQAAPAAQIQTGLFDRAVSAGGTRVKGQTTSQILRDCLKIIYKC